RGRARASPPASRRERTRAAARTRRAGAPCRAGAAPSAAGAATKVAAGPCSGGARRTPRRRHRPCDGARGAPGRRSRPAPRADRAGETANRSSSDALPAAQEAGERTQPVALGRERDVADPGGLERRDERAPLGRRRGLEALAQVAVAGVDAQLPPRLRIDDAQLADVGELLLARIANLDREHGVPGGEPEERRTPLERTAEVRD